MTSSTHESSSLRRRPFEDEIILTIDDVYKAFGDKQVLRGLTLKVHRGESVVIVGGSGVGKSVTLKLIIGLLQPDAGHVLVSGIDLCCLKKVELNQIRRSFGMSFQEGALFDSMNVFENIAFPLRRHTDKNEAEIADRVHECLELVHLQDVDTKKTSELSGGMRRRVGFARAIALEPDILLFDEPTTGLDPVISDVVADLILEMDQRLNTTTVTISHDMKVAYKIADRIAMVYQGRIIEEGTPEEFRESKNPIVRQFVEGRAEGPLTGEG
ncbi:MAG: ATP-binding cassette domain-containing protein [Thermoanaerobaculia bacterium]